MAGLIEATVRPRDHEVVRVPTTDHDRPHLLLGREECLSLLGTAGIGRLAYTEAALPAIRPVFFWLRAGDVVIPAHAGSPLVAAIRGAVVAFEADDYDDADRTGWSVTVVGPSRVLHAAPPQRSGPELCLIAVQFGIVQGWRTALPV
jgi:hypothetical protein